MDIEEHNRVDAVTALSAVITPIEASLEELDKLYWELSSEIDGDSEETRGNILVMEKIAIISKNLTIAGRGLALGIKQVKDQWDIIEH